MGWTLTTNRELNRQTTPTLYLIPAGPLCCAVFLGGWKWAKERKGKVGNFALRQSVGGMGKSVLSGRNYSKPLMVNVALFGKMLLGFPVNRYRASVPCTPATLQYGILPRTCVSHVMRGNEPVG